MRTTYIEFTNSKKCFKCFAKSYQRFFNQNFWKSVLLYFELYEYFFHVFNDQFIDNSRQKNNYTNQEHAIVESITRKNDELRWVI